MRYTIYVFDSNVLEFDQVLAPGRLDGRNRFERIPIEGVPFAAQGYLQRNRKTTPPWLASILPFATIPTPRSIANTMNSFVVAIRTVAGTMCAVTHGQGFMNLDKDYVVDGCGLQVAHRVLKPSHIKAVDSKGVGAASLQKRHVSSRTGDLSVFPLNPYRDRIRRIEGKSDNILFGARFCGGTSCVIDGKVTFPELGAICEAIIAARRGPKDRRFSATEPYTEVTDVATQAALQEKLRRALFRRDGSEIGAFTPDIEDWSNVSEIQVQYGNSDLVPITEFDAREIVRVLRPVIDGAGDIDAIKVHGFNGDGQRIFREPFKNLATFETEYKRQPYALSDGKWFLLDQHFLRSVTERISEIPVIDDRAYLPPWTAQIRNEEAYNLEVHRLHPQRLHVLDRQEIAVQGRGGVEPCDLLTMDGDFIHVKKWSASQTFSALMKQGENSASLLRHHQEFRDRLIGKLPVAWRIHPPWNALATAFRAGKHRIIYAVPAKPGRRLPDNLPIFSKMSLLTTVATLRADNFEVAFFHIHLHL